MALNRKSLTKGKVLPALLAAACVALPAGAGFALPTADAPSLLPNVEQQRFAFTPANVDPALAREVAASLGVNGMRFTPADLGKRNPRDVTVAVRVDNAAARAISVRRTVDAVGSESRSARTIAIAPTPYNLGIARGYQSFAKPVEKKVTTSSAVRNVPMADLADFRPDRGVAAEKPSRFSSRVAVESERDRGSVGRSASSFDLGAEQSVDVSGSYRVLKNLDVTAGVRYSQDRDRIAPLTTDEQDSQAVYVGTQFRF